MRRFILGTDWWSDCDDAVAIRLLARAVKCGEAELLGIAVNACKDDSIASLDGFLQTEGISTIPLGIDREATDFSRPGNYQGRLVKYAKKYKSNDDAEDGVRLYRRLLAEACCKVDFIEIGFYQIFAGLLESGPDDISEKSGIELVYEKVGTVYAMAGRWDRKFGHENNFDRSPRARVAAKKFCEMCPVPIVFLGFEVGVDVISGSHLSDGDVLKNVLIDHGSAGGRSSWDPMTVLLALKKDVTEAGYEAVRGTAYADDETGTNIFEKSDTGTHFYVKRLNPPSYYSDEIDRRIM